ncbi:MAG: pseudouridine-5'-phosphate glycosidase [Anaeromicrobium sp.]|jgi:pseudouridine-5'-phosphate glycosidase|uniref:pseudouridine-5'-phosphate glycosidase n=1 Tax=Anaeromicrobium sp. TaxID=1929132 RepID=UPI0025ED0AB3|nr:pseudouridine-5'-phosphate glycosidase [Anaeromicrobium sp.]MCT4595350.1 pseudouridine-5'-phosphate glycosidase [Anaeromicrobium sp.]
MYKQYLDIHPEVQRALDENKPVVALESTIISHGMPYPQNVETAKKVEGIVRDNGAVPATIAILNGRLKVGLTDEDLEYLGKGNDILKASRRDLPFIVAKKLNGATTVASTMIVAALAGIKVFVTGGIGGVHRGAETTFDVSADLQELANTNVAVICAGAKSILDIGLTLEYLETHGVPVVGFKTEELPAFYTRKSGFSVDYKADSELEVAKALKAKWDLGLKGGMVIGNPIPEEHQMDYDAITKAIEDALVEADEKGISGKESTPFLLGKVKEITKGKSLESNIELVFNNARVGSKIAVELYNL